MEKFYIVTNADFLNEIKDYNVHDEERRKLINEFFDEKGIAGHAYHIGGNGFCNRPFEDFEKHNIRLYVEDCEENNVKFGKELLKPANIFCDSDVIMRSFRANSKTLKEFQELCIERKIIINNHPVREGDYFKELRYGGYSVTRFEHDGKCYLNVKTKKDGITPESDGFTEIKGSEYYKALEEFESGN